MGSTSNSFEADPKSVLFLPLSNVGTVQPTSETRTPVAVLFLPAHPLNLQRIGSLYEAPPAISEQRVSVQPNTALRAETGLFWLGRWRGAHVTVDGEAARSDCLTMMSTTAHSNPCGSTAAR